MEELLVDLRLKVALNSNRFQHRKTNLAKWSYRDKCNAVSVGVAYKYVARFFETEFHDGLSEEIWVKALIHEYYDYMLSINKDGLISKSSYGYISANLLLCRHIHMAARILGHIIWFQTRKWNTSHQAKVSTPVAHVSDEIIRKRM